MTKTYLGDDLYAEFINNTLTLTWYGYGDPIPTMTVSVKAFVNLCHFLQSATDELRAEQAAASDETNQP